MQEVKTSKLPSFIYLFFTLMIIWDIFRDPMKDFISFGIAELDEKDKITFYKLSTKIKAFSKMTFKQVWEIHDVLKRFKTYRPEMGKDQSIMGVMTAYLDEEIFENINNLIVSDNKK